MSIQAHPIRRVPACLLAAFLVLMLGSPVTMRPADAQQPVTVRLVISETGNSADGYFAYEGGFFKKNGLNVELTQARSGAVEATAVAGGAADIGDGNIVTFATAYLHDIPFTAISAGYIYDSRDPFVVLAVAPNSPYKTPKDLNGKIIGVPVLNGISTVVMSAWADANGGADLKSFKYVEIPPSETIAALEQGRVAAVVLQDPQLAAEGSKVRIMAPFYDAISKRFLATVWFTTNAFAVKNPDVIRRFQLSINEGAAWAERNPELGRAALEKWLKLKTTRLRHLHSDKLEPSLMQAILDFATKYGMLSKPVNAADLIYAPK